MNKEVLGNVQFLARLSDPCITGTRACGVYSARAVVQRAQALGVDMPISAGVLALLDGQLRPAQAVAALMGRDPKDEQH